MKRTLLIALGALAMVASAKADAFSLAASAKTDSQIVVHSTAPALAAPGKADSQIVINSTALALAAPAKTDPQIVIHSTRAEEDERALIIANIQAQENLESWFKILAKNALTPHDPHVRALYNDWLKRNRKIDEEKQRLLAVDRLSDGDPIALAKGYDDAATIKRYLCDSGYNDLTDVQIVKVSVYMHANGIHHISELSAVSEVLTAKAAKL